MLRRIFLPVMVVFPIMFLVISCGDISVGGPTPVEEQIEVSSPSPVAKQIEKSSPTPVVEQTHSYTEIAQAIRPSVVRIKATDGVGSGFVISGDGLIVTNAHVIGDDSVVEVTLSNGSVRVGKVLDRNETVDIALLNIDGYHMPALDFHSIERPQVGDEVLAMGYALDLPGTASLTKGMVSAFRPKFYGDLTALQTDTAVNPGNSGGPLVNNDGSVIGIITSGSSKTEGINFAILMSEAQAVIQQLVQGKFLPSGKFVSEWPYSIWVPDGWNAYEISSSHVLFRDQDSTAEIVIKVESLPDGMTSEMFTETRTKLGTQGLKAYQKDSSEKITLATVPAWKIIETWRKEGNDYDHKGAEYFFSANAIGYSVYTQSERSEWDSVKELTDQIVRSLTIDFSVASVATPTGTAAQTEQVTPASSTTQTYFGPLSGNLRLGSDPRSLPVYFSRANVGNAVIEASFLPSRFGTTERSTLGLIFRRSGMNQEHIILIRNNQTWYHEFRGGNEKSINLHSGKSSHINLVGSGSNHLRVICFGNLGWLFINDHYIAQLNLSAGSKSGDVLLIGSYFESDFKEATKFDNFTIREIRMEEGPRKGIIRHTSSTSVTMHESSIPLMNDFVIEVNLHNPYSLSQGAWSSGLGFRSTKWKGRQNYLGVSSDGAWFHNIYDPALVTRGAPVNGIYKGPSDTNSILVISVEDRAWFFINDSYVATLYLDGVFETGFFHVFTNYYQGHGKIGQSTKFDGLTVWSVN